MIKSSVIIFLAIMTFFQQQAFFNSRLFSTAGKRSVKSMQIFSQQENIWSINKTVDTFSLDWTKWALWKGVNLTDRIMEGKWLLDLFALVLLHFELFYELKAELINLLIFNSEASHCVCHLCQFLHLNRVSFQFELARRRYFLRSF